MNKKKKVLLCGLSLAAMLAAMSACSSTVDGVYNDGESECFLLPDGNCVAIDEDGNPILNPGNEFSSSSETDEDADNDDKDSVGSSDSNGGNKVPGDSSGEESDDNSSSSTEDVNLSSDSSGEGDDVNSSSSTEDVNLSSDSRGEGDGVNSSSSTEDINLSSDSSGEGDGDVVNSSSSTEDVNLSSDSSGEGDGVNSSSSTENINLSSSSNVDNVNSSSSVRSEISADSDGNVDIGKDWMETPDESDKDWLDSVKTEIGDGNIADKFPPVIGGEVFDPEHNDYFCFTEENEWLRIDTSNLKQYGIPWLWNNAAWGNRKKYTFRFDEVCQAIFVKPINQ